jgi:hypothetical protein
MWKTSDGFRQKRERAKAREALAMDRPVSASGGARPGYFLPCGSFALPLHRFGVLASFGIHRKNGLHRKTVMPRFGY